LKGVLANSSLSNRAELMTALEKMSQPDPKAEQEKQMAAQQAQQAQLQLVGAQTADLTAKAQKSMAEAQQVQVDTQLAPQLAQAKLTAALATNLDNGNETKDFEQRARITELMLKEKDLTLKEEDSKRNERITMLQMGHQKSKDEAFSAAMNG
jgi:hypothetical protein